MQGLENLSKVFIPGSIKSGLRIWEAMDAEEKRKYDGLPMASNKRGYPIKLSDEYLHAATGIRNNNMNVSKSVGTFIYNENQKLKQPIKEFTNYLRGYDSQVYTQTDIDNIVNKYIDSQIEKKKLMRRFSDKLNIIKNIKYYSKKGNEVTKKSYRYKK